MRLAAGTHLVVSAAQASSARVRDTVPLSETRAPSRARQASLAAGLWCLVVLVCTFAWYALVPAVIAGLATAILFFVAGRRRWLRFMVLSAVVTGGIWTAFGTTTGYFWLNQHRLKRLVAEIEAVPAITSLAVGHVDESSRRDDGALGEDGGRPRTFDSYRFINDTVVTDFREQVAPDAFQPVLYVEDVLRSLHVPAERYYDLRRSLERLSLSGYHREDDGQVALTEPGTGGTPWGYDYVFSPTGEAPQGDGVQGVWRLAPHWFYVLWG